MAEKYFAHPSAYIDQPCEIGEGTKIWHFCHLMPHSKIGRLCILGQNVHVATQVIVGDNVRILHNVSLHAGCFIEDNVFLGPSCVFTNIVNPPTENVACCAIEQTRVCRGTTIGANATIVCGTTIGPHAFIAAGAVVTRDVPTHALMMGVPARQVGWMGYHGFRLSLPDEQGVMTCPHSRLRFRQEGPNVLRCLDVDKTERVPAGDIHAA